ncbi:mRNA splicing protein PRP45 KNAG_0D04930 [Huiozyma naganishii CBS 8797]|uniref:Pre-mRNA-processing protein 45 n=1 Tax=Huiozyma naganishii (strain ATCC MYA-139 / BCRC 22969 / CBS 8797 / KCTC 17520 / NBRC 10181 / NCYC 3082 / Yp74L-3) TaxID=1071383 RepID=J7RYJ0_HUIN7|nr:hypothetical protein KNAG_0D04930 [Kazachstania naganishii CBS 8797]CCK70232.1 hypothetical protein KNAG_0D04930 [Kazachstania naganishii CBS 8797]
MSFSSLLPAPVHSGKTGSNASGELLVNALVDDGDAVASDQYSAMVSRVTLHDFIPLRQRDFNMAIPLPSESEVARTAKKTWSHFQSLIGEVEQKSAGGRTEDELVVLPGGKRLHIVTAQHDPLQPKKASRSKKSYAPSNEDEPIQPILHTTSAGDNPSPPVDKRAWQIPSFVSQWKNPKGYTTALRGAGSVVAGNSGGEVTDGFVALADALEAADREARVRLQLKREAKVVELNRAVREREQKLNKIMKSVPRRGVPLHERDVSERIALDTGPRPTANRSHEGVAYDSRLFTKGATTQRQTESLYDNPLFVQQDIDSIYRPRKTGRGEATEDESLGTGPIEFTPAEEQNGDSER